MSVFIQYLHAQNTVEPCYNSVDGVHCGDCGISKACYNETRLFGIQIFMWNCKWINNPQ